MKRLLQLTLPLLVLVACERENVPMAEPSRAPEESVEHGMIQLGDKLEDPYTVENMKAALQSLYPTKGGEVTLSATDLYVRFLPKDETQLKKLQELGLVLVDHPVDYQIVRDGDFYQDPEIGEEAITWQYAVVPPEFSFPRDIRYELLDECYIAENDPLTKTDPSIDWELVEKEAFRLTGNADLWQESTKGGSETPQGRITIEDPTYSGGKPIGVSGVKVVANIFVKIATTYTDRDGYYKMGRSFRGSPRYRLMFQNVKGFKIGFNWIIIPASLSALGKGSNEGIDVHVTAESDNALFRRCAVNNAAYDFYSRCTEADLDITPPPSDLRIWIFPGLTSSSACMLHHGAFISDNSLIGKYLGNWVSLLKIFLPDLTLGTKEKDYAGIYKIVSHELSHACHYTEVGNSFWTPYIEYILKSFVTEGWDPYGSGTSDGYGYCEVGEMWGYFMQESLYTDRYGGVMRTFGNDFWFKPDIFTYLYDRGMSRAEIFRALGKDVTSVDDLREELIQRYPDRETLIDQTFRSYGKF